MHALSDLSLTAKSLLPLEQQEPKEIEPILAKVTGIGLEKLPFAVKDGTATNSGDAARPVALINKAPSSIAAKDSILSRLFRFVVVKPTHFVVRQPLNLISYSGLSCGWPSATNRQQVDTAVTRLSGSCDLAMAFNAISGFLAGFLIEKLTSLGLGGVLEGFLKANNSSLNDIVKVMLPKIFLNISKNTKERLLNENGLNQTNFTLIDAASCLIDVVQSHIPTIQSKIDFIDKIADPAKRERKLRQLFASLSHELLSIMLPEGVKELPFVHLPYFSERIWSQFKNEHFPDILLMLYRGLSSPFAAEDKSQLKKFKGGETLVGIAKSASQNAEEILRSLVVSLSVGDKLDSSSAAFRLANSFSSLLSGQALVKSTLVDWLFKQMREFEKSDQPEILALWKFLASYSEPILLRLFRAAAEIPAMQNKNPEKDESRYPDVFGVIAIKLCGVFVQFYNTRSEAINSRIFVLSQLGRGVEGDEQLLGMFSSLADDLVKVLGIENEADLPVPDFLKQHLNLHLKEILPGLLIKYFIALRDVHFDDLASQVSLRKLLFDPRSLKDPAIATSVVTNLHEGGVDGLQNLTDLFYHSLWDKSGTESLCGTLESMSSVISSKTIDALLSSLGISLQQAFNEEINPSVKKITRFSKSLVQSILLASFVSILEATPKTDKLKQKEHPRALFGLQLMIHLGGVFGGGLKNISEKRDLIEKEHAKDPVRLILEKRKLFSPLASDLHEMIAENPLDLLPFHQIPGWESIKASLWESVKTSILPAFLETNYKEVMSWSLEKQESLDLLEACYHTTHPAWACRVIAEYAGSFIKHYLKTSNDDAAGLLFQAVLTFFGEEPGSQGKAVYSTFVEKEDLIRDILSENLQAVGKSQENSITDVWPFVTEYIEAIIAKAFAKISSQIHSIEKEHPDFMIDAANQMLKATSEYFNILNQQEINLEKDPLYTASPAMVLAGFGNKLHDGVPLDPAASAEERNQTRLEGLLIPLADKLMRLADIKPGDLPLPPSVREPIGELLVESLLPQILLSIDQTILEPHIRDSLMLNFIEMLYSTLNGLEASRKQDVPDVEMDEVDLRRKQLNESCGAVVFDLVKLIPDTMVQYVFMKEKVKDMSAEAIGDAIMAYLSKWTLLQLIDTLIFVVLPSLHPAKWEGKVGQEALVPRKTVYQEDGSPALKTIKRFKFTFPETAKEIAEQKKCRKEEADRIQRELRDGFTKTISSQLFVKAWDFIKAIWKDFQIRLDAAIIKYFPNNGPKVKSFLDEIFHKLFFDLAGPVLQFVSHPLIQLIKYLTEKIIIDRKSEDIINNLHSPALEHLINKWIDIITDTLVKLSDKRDLPDNRPLASA